MSQLHHTDVWLICQNQCKHNDGDQIAMIHVGEREDSAARIQEFKTMADQLGCGPHRAVGHEVSFPESTWVGAGILGPLVEF